MKPIHGHATGKGGLPTQTYCSWMAMKRRCLAKDSEQYKWYGGRGIKVCERWLLFANFLNDMGERPIGKTLDRINNDGNYDPSNCRWATAQQQLRNKQKTILIERNGVKRMASEWADLLGIKRITFYKRLQSGMTGKRLLSVKRLSRWEQSEKRLA